MTRREALAGVGGEAGIVTPRQDHLTLAAFDVHTPDRDDLRRLLANWTGLVVALCEGAARDPEDTGEADGLGTRGLTITVGFGASPSLCTDRRGGG